MTPLFVKSDHSHQTNERSTITSTTKFILLPFDVCFKKGRHRINGLIKKNLLTHEKLAGDEWEEKIDQFFTHLNQYEKKRRKKGVVDSFSLSVCLQKNIDVYLENFIFPFLSSLLIKGFLKKVGVNRRKFDERQSILRAWRKRR